MRVVVVFEAESVKQVLSDVAKLESLEVISINEQAEPKVQLHAPGYRGDAQGKVADAVRSQTAPAVVSE